MYRCGGIFRRGEYEECLKCLDRAMNLHNEDFNDIYYSRALCYYDMGDMVQAKKYFLKSFTKYCYPCSKTLKNIDKHLNGKTKKKFSIKVIPITKECKKYERKNKIKKRTNRNKMNDGRILTEEQVESDNLWAGVKSGINYGSFEDKNILFCNCIVGLRCKEGLELIGQANYIDKEIYKEIIEKYNIDEDKILIEGK